MGAGLTPWRDSNLGARAGLLAGRRCWRDYVLTAAVGISAGVGALDLGVSSSCSRTR